MAANVRLRALFTESGLSLAAFARHVTQLAADEGINVGTNRTSITRMLAGTQPRDPVPRLVAAVLTRLLGRPVDVTDCGFRATLDYDGLRPYPTLELTVHTVVDLSGHDMHRRNFLRGAAFTAGAFAEPALLSLSAPAQVQSVAPTTSTGRRPGPVDVDLLASELRSLRRMDQHHGAHQVHHLVARLVHEHAPLVTAAPNRAVASALCSTLSQTTALAGWTAIDLDRHALGQRYFIQALSLARHGGDLPYAANLLAHMARLTLTAGERLAPEEAGEHARHCVGLARTGLATAERCATPGLRALLHVTAARGHAMLGDIAEAGRSLHRARAAFDLADPATEPEWLVYRTTPTEFGVDVGRVLRDTGHAREAEPVFRTALAAYPEWQPRRRGVAQFDLALAALAADELEQAAHAIQMGLAVPEAVTSSKGQARIVMLRRRLTTHHRRSSAARDLSRQLELHSASTRF